MITVGLDVHQRNTMVFWIDNETGETSGKAYNVSTQGLAAEMSSIPDPKGCVLESGSYALFVADQLESCGVESHVVQAMKARRMIESLFGLKKTDKIDAQGLARAWAQGCLRHAEIWVADLRTRVLRELTRTRTRAVEGNVRARNHLRDFIGRLGRPCDASDIQGKGAVEWLDALEGELTADLRLVLQSLRRRVEHYADELEPLDAQIATHAVDHPDYELLQTIPGVGAQLAACLAAEIGEIERFESAVQLCGYSGLVPEVSQTGDRTRMGPLTKAGNRHLRRALVLAAQHFSRHQSIRGSRLHRWYWRLVCRRGRNPAKVALARRLCIIIYGMLRDRVPFDASRYFDRATG